MESEPGIFSTTDNLPIVNVHGPAGQRSFEVQLFPVVPVTFHLVNNKLDPDSAASTVAIAAILNGGLERAAFYPVFLNNVTDTIFTLSGYGNVQNMLRVTLAKDGSEIYGQTQVFSSRETVKEEVNY